MTALEAALAWLMERVQRFVFDENRGLTLAVTLLLLLVTLALERRASPGRELGFRNILTDAIYMGVYFGGVFAVLISTPLRRVFESGVDRFAPWLRPDAAPPLPWLLHLVVFFVVIDLTGYLTHRLQHWSPTLWAFHSIHHSQQRMSVLTNFRFHFVDTLCMTVVRFLPALMLAPRRSWLPLSLSVLALHLLAHTGRDWTLGPLERLLVSPRFHSIHHSRHPAHADRNFGMLFSFWDRWLGTAYSGSEPVRDFGVQEAVPESFVKQLVWPFRRLGRSPRQARIAT